MASQRPSRFALLRKLGEGSIGLVYEAYDRERHMRVALKTLRHLDRAGFYRLKQEFRAVRSLNHPNIVTLHELVDEGNGWYITMELVEGDDFVAYVRTDGLAGDRMLFGNASGDASGESSPEISHRDLHDGKSESNRPAPAQPDFAEGVDESRLRRTLAQLAQGLHAIHLAGLIHRDLKPSNVLVTKLGRTVLMDFSIVAEARNARDQSSSGAIVIGTPWYMAPEQATGDPPSPAIDWYGMGAMMYQAITGRVPFEGHWEEVLLDKQQLTPAPPSQLVAGVPQDLDQLCVELLARRPQDRPTGDEVLRRLGVASDDVTSVVQGLGESTFVGRQDELAELANALGQASSSSATGLTDRPS